MQQLCLDTDTLSNFRLHTQAANKEQHRERSIATRVMRENDPRVRSLAAVIALAVMLRILFLGKSLWLDEGIAVGNAWAAGLPLHVWPQWFAQLWSRSEFNMVFYFAALRFWLRAGTSESFIRLLSVIPAIVSLPVVYAIGKRLFDRRIAFVAMLLLAVHGAHIAYSQEARGYTMVVFFCTASTYFFVRGIEGGAWSIWCLYGLTAALGTYSHLFALLVVASHCISLLAVPRQTVPWRRLLATSVLLLAAVTPAIAFAISNHGHQVDWIPRLRASQVVNVLSELAGSPVALLPYLVLWGFGVAYCRRVWRADTYTRWHTAIVLSWAVAPLLIVIAISFTRPMLVPRYLLISAPASVLLAALGAYEMRPRTRKITLWAAVLLSVGFVAYRYTRPKENWRDATAYVISHAHDGDAVVVVPQWSEPVFDYYRRRNHGPHIVEIDGSALGDAGSFVSHTSDFNRVWVVTYTREYALKEPDSRMVSEVTSKRFQPLATANFRMLQVRCYVPRNATAITPN